MIEKFNRIYPNMHRATLRWLLSEFYEERMLRNLASPTFKFPAFNLFEQHYICCGDLLFSFLIFGGVCFFSVLPSFWFCSTRKGQRKWLLTFGQFKKKCRMDRIWKIYFSTYQNLTSLTPSTVIDELNRKNLLQIGKNILLDSLGPVQKYYIWKIPTGSWTQL